jgi:2Fe-2S ferredoxin
MTSICFVAASGERTVIDATPGTTVMQAAVANGVDGIVGECGGSAMCATCHVYVEPPAGIRLPELSSEEYSMLDSTVSERRSNSRLSCQLTVSPELEGLVLLLPERQA